MKSAQARSLIGKTVYFNFRVFRGREAQLDVPVRVIDVGTRTVLVELPSGRVMWWRLSAIMGYYEKGKGRKGE